MTTSKPSIVIIEALRTPHGLLGGQLSRLSASEMGAVVVRGLLSMTRVDAHLVDGLIMGCVLQAGVGQAPARQTALRGGLLSSVSALTLNKVCGSGMEALMMGALLLETSAARVVLAGGMESMSNAPLLLRRPRKGSPQESRPFGDHLFLDGLEDAYAKIPMGVFAEAIAKEYLFSREMQDAFAALSLTRAQKAAQHGWFQREIIPVDIQTPDARLSMDQDENLGRASVEKIPYLKPAFKEGGTITAASSSGIADGASGVLLTHEKFALQQGLPLRARIVAMASYAHEPERFALAPIGAIRSVLNKAAWSVHDVDLFEINEAFSVVPMAAEVDLHISREKINVYGGACAIGHPIGSSGARIVVTLINALRHSNKKRGVAAVCIGGGEALSMAIELI